jgi:hypothetical protein
MKFTPEEKKKYRALYRQSRESEIARLDSQEQYFMELIAFAATHTLKEIPEKHLEALPVARASVPWRSSNYVHEKIKETAHLFAVNEIVRARNGQA